MNAIPVFLKEPHLNTTRVRFENVLVAVDLSADSANTLKAATELAQRFGSSLTAVHVLHETPALLSEAAENVERKIRLWMKPYLKSDTPHSITIAHGNVVGEISRLVKDYRADLLVIGTHGTGNAKKLAFGSTAETLFRSVGVPVLTVGPHVQSCGEPFFSILLPTDLEPHSFRAAQYGVSLAEECNARLTVLHVLGKHDGHEAHQEASRRMQQLVPEDAALWCNPVFRTATGDPAEMILAAAEQSDARLIVLGVTQGHPWADRATWSIASRIVRESACPVLTVRDHL
jgi:nucleotide-binding universal stress UspA family protein